MPKITVEIEWDQPTDPFWLNADNVSLALHAYCPNTRFQVQDAGGRLTPSDERWPHPPLIQEAPKE